MSFFDQDATMALAKGARMGGAKIIEGVTVTGMSLPGVVFP